MNNDARRPGSPLLAAALVSMLATSMAAQPLSEKEKTALGLCNSAANRQAKNVDREAFTAQCMKDQLAQTPEPFRLQIGQSAAIVRNYYGYPSEVNRTETRLGIHEQWVYPGRKYLYFTNGALTAIQE